MKSPFYIGITWLSVLSKETIKCLSNKNLYFPLRSPRTHPEDGQGPGGGHQDPGGRRRLLPGAAGRGRPERRLDHRDPLRRGEERGRQPGLAEPGGPGDAHQRREGRDERPGGPDAGHQVGQREELPAPRHAHSEGLGQGKDQQPDLIQPPHVSRE